MTNKITEQFADGRRIERAEIIDLVGDASLESGTRCLCAVEHRNKLIGIFARTDHWDRQIVIYQLEQLFQNAEASGTNDKTRTKQANIHAPFAPLNGKFFGLQLGKPVLAERLAGMVFLLRPSIVVPIHHVGGEVDQLVRPCRIHRPDDVFRPVIIDGKKEIMPFCPDLYRREHLGGQIVNHVISANA